jgi:type I restriction enzyme, S subunit
MSDFPMTTWLRSDCAVFFRVAEPHGGCSNMAGGMPIDVIGCRFRTSEALYQVLRFPDHPDVQEKIIEQKSPMGAKMAAKASIALTRSDWDDVRVPIMKWAIRMKRAQNDSFGVVLSETGTAPIVEQSRKDDFWGAREHSPGVLTGRNVLGLLLMDLRDGQTDLDLSPPVDRMILFGQQL